MDAKSFEDAAPCLGQLMDQVVDNAEPVIITRTGKAAVVLVSLDEWNNLQETAYLARSPANRERGMRRGENRDFMPAPREFLRILEGVGLNAAFLGRELG